MKIKLALVSVSDKTGVVDFARRLAAAGVRILSTGGTARALRDGGVEVTDVSAHTGSPEIMDGRVKTLHPKIHGGILCVRDNDDHMKQAEENGILPVDLVCVNLYPFARTVAKAGATREEIIENIDIGGPSMVRSAAKNHRYVTIVTDPADYARVGGALERGDGAVDEALRTELAAKAYAHTAQYDAAISAWMAGGEGFPDQLTLAYSKVRDLRYGENPHQAAAVYRAAVPTGPSVVNATVHGGKELSYNNILDLDSAYELALELPRPGCAIIKHNNPCGAARGDSVTAAFKGALKGDPVSAFGGLIAFNVEVDVETAGAIARKDQFFEGIVAPGYAEGAIDVLKTGAKWGKNVRILETSVPASAHGRPWRVRGITDGALIQTADAELTAEVRPAGKAPDDAQKADLEFAWIVCKHVRSNAIVLAKDGRITGVGAGQMSRVDSSHMAVRKAGDDAKGSVAASDAFFPFSDALDVLIDAGISAVIQPGGSIRDKEVLAGAEEKGVPVLLTGMRHFKH